MIELTPYQTVCPANPLIELNALQFLMDKYTPELLWVRPLHGKIKIIGKTVTFAGYDYSCGGGP